MTLLALEGADFQPGRRRRLGSPGQALRRQHYQHPCHQTRPTDHLQTTPTAQIQTHAAPGRHRNFIITIFTPRPRKKKSNFSSIDNSYARSSDTTSSSTTTTRSSSASTLLSNHTSTSTSTSVSPSSPPSLLFTLRSPTSTANNSNVGHQYRRVLALPTQSKSNKPTPSSTITTHSPSHQIPTPTHDYFSNKNTNKPAFRMPFRDRMARRFAETVSPSSMSIHSPLASYMPFTSSSDFFQDSPSDVSPAFYTSGEHVSNIVSNVSHLSDPRLGSPTTGRGLSCARPYTAARRAHSERAAKILDLGDDEGDKFPRKALGLRLLRTGAVRKSFHKSEPRAGPRARPFRASTGAATTVAPRRSTRYMRSSMNSSSSSSPDTSLKLSGRTTRASSKMTDENGQQLSPTSAYLSYHDVLLTYEDIKMLKNNDWLTDNNITFWEEWLEHEVLPAYPQARITLLRPSLAHLLMINSEKPADLRDVLPNMTKVTHIFMPINDAVSRTNPDGSHWSLLLVSKIDGVAFHYDSLGGSNNQEARRATERLSQLLGMQLRFHIITDCPQQENGNDCGVFVCILMRHLLVKRLLNAHAREKVSMSMSNKMIDARGGRKEMLKIIDSLRKEAERRRSASPFGGKNDTPPRIE